MTIRAIGSKIIVKEIIKEEAKSGIVVPDSIVTTGQTKAEVIAVGNGILLENGSYASLRVAIGETVWFSEREGVKIKHKGQDLYVITENEILFTEGNKQ